MPIGRERTAVQNPFLRYAEEAGWTYLSPEAALDLRRGLTSPVLDTVLLDQLQKLNPGIVDHPRAEQIRDRLVRVRPNIEGNLTAWEYLKGLKTVFVELQKRELNVRVLDPVNLDANAFHVTDELTFSNCTPPDIRADLVFFVNGVPIIVGETKSSKKREGIAEAFDDLRYYHRHGPELLAVLQLHCLTHLVQFYYGATWNLTRKGLFNWRADRRGLIVSMIHKFDGIEADVITRENVYVLVDEAHRSTGGDLGNYLMGALPNATYIGFTGTPIDRTSHGKGTFKVFGTDDPKRYLDKYSILESVTDGTTLPLHYELAPNDLLVDRAVYWMLKRDGVEKAGEVARAAADAFDRHPHWRTSRHQEQDVRKAFYKALIDAGVDGVVDVAQGILRMLGASR
jgi:type I site-specific restriction-modification system R (restriction) subunit